MSMRHTIIFLEAGGDLDQSVPSESVHIFYDGYRDDKIVVEVHKIDRKGDAHQFDIELTESQENIVKHAMGKQTDRDRFDKVFEEAHAVAMREDLDPGEIGGIARLRDELFKRRRDL